MNSFEISSDLNNILCTFKNLNILVIGDVFLDQYVMGVVKRVSPEAPIPILEKHSDHSTLGGAANVANNLAKWGVNVDLIGYLGNDKAGQIFQNHCEKSKIQTDKLIYLDSHNTITKKRYISGNYQILRVDNENLSRISPKIKIKLYSLIAEIAGTYDAIIISDYAKGVIDQRLVDIIGKTAMENGVSTIIDPKPKNKLNYKFIDVVKPNKTEALLFSGSIVDDSSLTLYNKESILTVYQVLKDKYCVKNLFITLGGEGAAFISENGSINSLPSKNVEVFDVSGAGDTVNAAFASFVAAGGSYEEASRFAMAAAGLAVSQAGTATVDLQNILTDYN